MKSRAPRVAGWLLPLLLLCAAPAAAGAPLAEPEARVRLEPAYVEVGEGLTAAVQVRIEGVRDLYAFDIRLAFDPAVVQVADADPASPGTQVQPGGLLKLDVVARNAADNEAGTVWFAMSQANPSPAVSGSGVALVVTFRGLAGGKHSPLAVSYARLATRDGHAIPAVVQGGELAVVAAEQAAATPTPAPPPERPALEQTALAPTMAPVAEGSQARPEPAQARTPLPALLAAVAGGLVALAVDGWQRWRRRGEP